MILLFLVGVIILIIGFALAKNISPATKYNGIFKISGLIILIIAVGFSLIVQVEPGEVGVQKLFGKVDNRILESGLNIVNPFVQVVTFDTRTQNYTMSAVHDEGAKSGDDAIRVLSADGLEVIVDLTVLYKVIPTEAPRILREIGTDYINVIVRPICRTKIRDNAVYYDAVALYSTKRDEFQARYSRV